MDNIRLYKLDNIKFEKVFLPSSKSESNRVLVISALAGGESKLKNLSSARDTQTMLRLLSDEESKVWDVLDAGTTMRFLTAYTSVMNIPKVMTGTDRMKQRPIAILFDALKTLGVDIEYMGEEGFPPVQIHGFSSQITNELSIRGDVSSQYISALLMIAPYLEKGLRLRLEGKIGSKPYIEMTLSLMTKFGVKGEWLDNQTLEVLPSKYTQQTYFVESDWSGASYWYSFVALSENSKIKLIGLKEDSLQGDQAIVEIMSKLGVKSTFDSEGVLLENISVEGLDLIDFTPCPDLAQTVAVVCSVKGIESKMIGLESLKIKETDRVLALQQELEKIGGGLIEHNSALWEVKKAPSNWAQKSNDLEICTYEDHRMAMAFAPLVLFTNIKIQEPDVVNKSYPSFWEDLKKVGVKIDTV